MEESGRHRTRAPAPPAPIPFLPPPNPLQRLPTRGSTVRVPCMLSGARGQACSCHSPRLHRGRRRSVPPAEGTWPRRGARKPPNPSRPQGRDETPQRTGGDAGAGGGGAGAHTLRHGVRAGLGDAPRGQPNEDHAHQEVEEVDTDQPYRAEGRAPAWAEAASGCGSRRRRGRTLGGPHGSGRRLRLALRAARRKIESRQNAPRRCRRAAGVATLAATSRRVPSSGEVRAPGLLDQHFVCLSSRRPDGTKKQGVLLC
jgi:hypothetical protein